MLRKSIPEPPGDITRGEGEMVIPEGRPERVTFTGPVKVVLATLIVTGIFVWPGYTVSD
jgi:hypothetical protein